MSISIVLADDHHVVRQGLRALLEAEPHFFVKGEAGDGLTALQMVENLRPDILVLDLMMPGLNGLEVTRQATKLSPSTRIIILSMHAGEAYGPASIKQALHYCGAHRIGHGVRAMEDPLLLAYLLEHRIPLEINPTSNLRLHIYPHADQHPFALLDQMGLLVTVNSDDPPLFNTTLCAEYEFLAQEFGYDRPNLRRIARNAFTVAGVEAEVKARLLEEFDGWGG